jgi:hypothetical protein
VFDALMDGNIGARMLEHDVADPFFAEVVTLARAHGWVLGDHFSVDGTLIESLALVKSFRAKDDQQGPGPGNACTDFKGRRGRNETHKSTTDWEATLVRKGPGKEARMCFAGNAMVRNFRGLCVLFDVTTAVSALEAAVAVGQMTELRNRGFSPKTVGGDNGYHFRELGHGLRDQGLVPHPARKDRQRTLLVPLSFPHVYSQKVRKRIEEIFGWANATGCFRNSRYLGVERTNAPGSVRRSRLQPIPDGKIYPRPTHSRGPGHNARRASGLPAHRETVRKQCVPSRTRRANLLA